MELYLSLGSDTGDRRKCLEEALNALDEAFGVEGKEVSDVIETEPWGFESDTEFLNLCVRYEVDVPRGTSQEEKAMEILDILHGIEERLGREKHEARYDSQGKRIYSSRTIDIDIVFFGDLVMDTARLTIPHPHAAERDFVMVPLRQIATHRLKGSFPWVQ